MATTVRVDDRLHSELRELSNQENRPIGEVIADAIERYQKAKFWEQARADFQRLRSDPAEWADYQAEIAVWDALAGDGLEGEEPYYTPEEEAELDAESA